MFSFFLLLLVTCAYTGYNLLIKQSSSHAEMIGGSTVTATVSLQLAALFTSLLFLLMQRMAGETVATLPAAAYGWAIVAGVCIGIAEIGYFYLFTGIGGQPPVSVSIAVPIVVGGTVVLAMLGAWLFFADTIELRQWFGAGCVVVGLFLIGGK